MFNLGLSEVIVIGVIALIVIGPKQLPEVAKVIGRLLTELRKATQDLSGGLLEVKREVQSSVDDLRTEISKAGRGFSDSVLNPEELNHEGHHEPDAHEPHPHEPELESNSGAGPKTISKGGSNDGND